MNENRAGANDRPEVDALMLTHDAPTNAVQCARAIGEQTSPPRSLLVVENPGRNAVDLGALERASTIPVALVTLERNEGPAGGYAAGLAHLHHADFVWIIDDDLAPSRSCLEILLRVSEEHHHHALVFPELVDADTGEPCSTWGWVGVLVPGDAIRAAGVPNGDLFYGCEDQDYLIDRCGQAGYPLVRAEEALASLQRRSNSARPPWHFYYLPRNTVYQHLYRRGHVRFDYRMKRLAVGLWRLFAMIEGDARERSRRYLLFARGVIDGVCKRLGRRVDPGADAQRPGRPPAARS